MDFVHKQHIPFLEIVKDGSHLPRLLNGRAAGHLHAASHLVGYDSGQGGLAQPRRAVEQHMVQRLIPVPGSLYIYFQGGFKLFLPHVILKTLRAQRCLYTLIFRRYICGYNPAFHIHLN